MSCGTDRGVKAHKGRNEPPCKFCRKFLDNPTPAPVVIEVSVQTRRTTDREVQYQKAPARKPAKPATKAAVKQSRKARTAAEARPVRAPQSPKPPKASRVLKPCGTTAARSRHIKNGEPVCEPCRLAYNADSRKGHARRNPPMDRSHIVCGTLEGYGRHTWLKEPACQPCLDAKAAASRESYVRKTEPLPPAVCGTTRGYRKHTTDKTPYCQPCRDAYNQRRAASRAEQKGAAA